MHQSMAYAGVECLNSRGIRFPSQNILRYLFTNGDSGSLCRYLVPSGRVHTNGVRYHDRSNCQSSPEERALLSLANDSISFCRVSG